MRYLKQSTASQTRTIGPFVDDTDFKTAETALSIANTDVRLKKNGADDVAKNSGGATHDVNGCYHLTFDATDTDTVGELFYTVKVAGALQVFGCFTVLEEAIYDALFAASANAFTGAAGSSKITGVVLTDTLTTYTGNTVQTGDSYAIVNSGTHGNAAIKGYVDDIGAAGAGLTAVPWNAAWDAEVQSEVEDAIVVHRLDELLNADSDIDGASPPTVGSVFHELMTKTTGSFTFDQTTDSLEALRDNHPANFSTLTIASNAALATLSNLAHGGTSATLRLGSSTTTPALYATNSGGNAVRFESTGNDGHGLLALGVGAGDGVHFEGGVDGDGAHLQGGATTGRGIHATGGAGAAYLDGSVSLTSTLTVSGATSLAALSMTTLTASGAVAFQSTFAVTTSTSLAALSCTTLTASGAVALQSTVTVTGATSLAALSMTTLTASGAVALQSTLIVTGATTLTGAVTATNASNAISGIAGFTAAGKAEINAEMLDVINVDTFSEPTGVPAATNTLVNKLSFIYAFGFRNKITVTSSKMTFYDDGDAAEFEKDLSDDGTTYTETEANAV